MYIYIYIYTYIHTYVYIYTCARALLGRRPVGEGPDPYQRITVLWS